ncbi:MAG: ATP-binding protein [Candidatus Kapabacteria bacterium]|jgi:signal transduction histidine kinase/ligand-binding sensor domain-containing protein|nr:ATP-binding protein [Candidatus Kapabacteria bacterium]
MRLFGRFAFLFVQLFFAQKLSSQQGAVRFEHLSIEQGLSQSSVHRVVQDKRGFIWLGTQDGLNKYDGYTFTVFRHKPSDTTTLSDNWITDLYEDNVGQLWVMTRNGLNLFDAAQECFRRFALPLVKAICSDSSGRVFIGTVQGLFVFDHKSRIMRQISNHTVYGLTSSKGQILVAGAQGAWKLIGSDLQALSTDPRLAGKPVWAVYVAERSTIVLFSTFAARIDEASGRVAKIIDVGGVVNAQQNLFSILPAEQDSYWLHTPFALTLWQPETGKRLQYSRNDVGTNTLAGLINDIEPANADEIWVGTNQGLWIISQKTALRQLSEQTTSLQQTSIPRRIEPDATEPDALNDEQVLSLYQDRLGTMWAGTRTGGANLWNPRRYKFGLVRHNPFNAQSLGSGGVRSFLHDANGGLWVGTDKGLNYRAAATGRWTRFVSEPTNPRSLSFGYVTSLVYDNRGKLWIGTRGGGLNRLDEVNTRTGKAVFTRFLSNAVDSASLGSNAVWSLHKARKSAPVGHIWIATQGGGLHLLNPETAQIQRFRHNPLEAKSLTTDSLRAVFEDSKGRVWLGTSGYGLLQFSRENGVIASYRSSLDSTSLSNNTVTGIFEDSGGTLWVTSAAGLNKLIEGESPANACFERYSVKEGLPNEFIYGICEDSEGNLWMSTNNGLACLSPKTRVIRSFDVHDGLQSNEFNTGAFYKANDGALYFGGVQGYNTFHAQAVLAYKPSALPVVLISFKVHDQTRAFTQPLAELKDIELAYNENEISFEFVALDFTGASKQIRYQYMLESFDRDWLVSGTRRYAAYTNLEPGEYRFRVKANNGANSAGTGSEGASILIRIRPPFWATWWFRLLALGGVIALVWSGLQWRLRGIRRKNELLEKQVRQRTEQLTGANEEIQRQNVQLHDQNIALELAIGELAQLNREKNEFLGIAAHDLKNPLTGIMLSVQLLERHRKKMTEEDFDDSLRKIYQSAERMFAIITNLLDINAIESGKFNFTTEQLPIDKIVRGVVEDFQARASAKKITLLVEHFPSEGSSFLALGDKAATTEVLENLVSNAVKYSPLEKRVWVRVLSGSPEVIGRELLSKRVLITRPIPAQAVVIAVQDEGQGLSESDKKLLFGRFVKLSPRPTAGEHSTGLGLSIVKRMVEAMNGEVWCETELGKGATFLVALPILRNESYPLEANSLKAT